MAPTAVHRNLIQAQLREKKQLGGSEKRFCARRKRSAHDRPWKLRASRTIGGARTNCRGRCMKRRSGLDERKRRVRGRSRRRSGLLRPGRLLNKSVRQGGGQKMRLNGNTRTRRKRRNEG